MVTRKENIRPIIKEQMRGGDGRAVQTPVIDEAQFCGHGRLFAKMTNTELVVIDDKTDINSFEQQLALLDAAAALKR